MRIIVGFLFFSSFLSDKWLIQERKAQAVCLSPSSPPLLTPADWPVLHLVAQACLTLCSPLDCRLLCPWDSPGKNTGVGYHALLQGIVPSQGSKPGLPHCRQVLCRLSTRAGRQTGLPSPNPLRPRAGGPSRAERGWMTLPLLLWLGLLKTPGPLTCNKVGCQRKEEGSDGVSM